MTPEARVEFEQNADKVAGYGASDNYGTISQCRDKNGNPLLPLWITNGLKKYPASDLYRSLLNNIGKLSADEIEWMDAISPRTSQSIMAGLATIALARADKDKPAPAPKFSLKIVGHLSGGCFFSRNYTSQGPVKISWPIVRDRLLRRGYNASNLTPERLAYGLNHAEVVEPESDEVFADEDYSNHTVNDKTVLVDVNSITKEMLEYAVGVLNGTIKT